MLKHVEISACGDFHCPKPLQTYFIPRHCLLPLEKAIIYRSSARPESGLVQRSGMKSYELGKTDSLWCIITEVIPTGVCL